jgi:periplasmic protein TonB
MPRRLQFTKFIFFSLAFHAALIAAALLLIKPAEFPSSVPVSIVNLPPQALKKLPRLDKPSPPPRNVFPEKPRPSDVPMPKKFGAGDELRLPGTSPRTGASKGPEQGGVSGKNGAALSPAESGPLPFLTQRDIDELARKGMPERAPGDNSVTLDTDEFKYISYNRWLKIRVESVLRYPELAAVSGYQGALYIKFDILKDGSLGDVEVLKSSGYKILDDEALRSIREAAPFQPLPPEWNIDRYSIRAAVIFYLGTGYIQ